MNRAATVLSTFFACLCFTASAQEYPAKPVKMIVPWPPGGVVDVVGRIVAKELSIGLGQPVIVENKAGAGGMIGVELASKAEPDGYTILVTSSSLAYYSSLYRKLPFDPVEGLAPIAPLARAPHLLVAAWSAPFKSVAEIVAQAKASPGNLTYASAGPGSPSHLAGELFKKMSGSDILHVPYKGAEGALVDVLGGRVQMFFSTIAATLPHMKSDKIRIVAIGSAERSPLLPDVRTISESGVPGFESTLWIGAFAPAGTPGRIIERLNVEMAKTLKTKAATDAYAMNGLDPATSSPREFGDFFRKDVVKWGAIIKAANLQAD